MDAGSNYLSWKHIKPIKPINIIQPDFLFYLLGLDRIYQINPAFDYSHRLQQPSLPFIFAISRILSTYFPTYFKIINRAMYLNHR